MPFQQKQPLADVWYRIQNVDYVYNLEFAEPTAGEACVGRLLKESDTQFWKFIPTAPGAYKIVNASSHMYNSSFALAVDTKNPVYGGISENEDGSKIVWNVMISLSSEYCTITTQNPKNARTQVNLQMEPDGSVKVTADTRQNNQKWRILEVSPSLPQDTYRIRHMDGVSLLTVHDDSLTVHAPEQGKHQGWEVSPQGNGRCQIKKVAAATQYLAWEEGEDGIVRVNLSPNPVTWITKAFGGFAYSVSADTKKNLDLALALAENEELVLRPRKPVHNQVWFFEPSKFDLEIDAVETGTRFPDIPDGKYNLQSVGTQTWIRSNEDPSRAYPDSSKGRDAMRITYVHAGSPYFTIQSIKENRLEKAYLVPFNDLLVMSDVAATWYLAKDRDTQGYYICSSAKGKVPRVLTATTKKDLNGNDVYTLADKAANTPNQMWRLVTS